MLHHCSLDLDQLPTVGFQLKKNISTGRHLSSAEIKVFLQNKYLFHFHICDLKCSRNNILKTRSCPGKKKRRTGAFWECWSAKSINEFMWHYLIATAQKTVRSHRSWLQHQKLWNGNKIAILFSSCLKLLYSIGVVSWQHCESNVDILPVNLRSIILCSSFNQDSFQRQEMSSLPPPSLEQKLINN